MNITNITLQTTTEQTVLGYNYGLGHIYQAFGTIVLLLIISTGALFALRMLEGRGWIDDKPKLQFCLRTARDSAVLVSFMLALMLYWFQYIKLVVVAPA